MANRSRVYLRVGELLTKTTRRIGRKIVTKDNLPYRRVECFKLNKVYDRRGKR